ncbi:MAG: ribonuclease R family protein [Phycisphaerae bacterium]
MESLRNRILKIIRKNDYRSLLLAELAELLSIGEENAEQFDATVDRMLEEGLLTADKDSRLSLPKGSDFVRGTYRSTRQSFGFVSPLIATKDGDVRVEWKDSKGAVDGDIVQVKVMRRFRGSGGNMLLGGRITKIIERARSNSTGTVYHNGERWMIVPDGDFFKAPFEVDDIKAKGAKNGDKVYFEVLKFPDGSIPGKAVIIEVLGKAGVYDTEIEATIRNYGLPREFPKACIEQAHRASQTNFKPGKGYDDILDKFIITIDPDDAKDFDDAISVERDADGNPVLGVHIADVSRFVREGSALDAEAALRGNSVYLPGRVLPMLPEILSNGVCSLQPHQKRYAKSVYITYDSDGNVIEEKTRYANSLMQSSARLTYLQADAMLRGEKLDFAPEVYALLRDMDSLARTIEQRRKTEGMLHLDLPDIDLVLNDDGEVVDANPADNSYPHTIIEMFMVEANEAIARLFDKYNVPFLRRIHPDPDPFSLQKLTDFVSVLGFELPPQPGRSSLRVLLEKVRGTGMEYAVNTAVLRSFERAVYSPENLGHYALASQHYAHFTSPIRRYADLTIHRLYAMFLEKGRLDTGFDIPTEDDLAELGRHISETENDADSAERDLKKVLILLMLEKRIGDKLHCYVSGITRKGIFVQCKKFGIEGFIASSELGRDDWDYNEKSQRLTGRYSGVSVHIGLELDVTISKVDVPTREITFTLVEMLVDKEQGAPKKGAKGNKPAQNKQGSRGGKNVRGGAGKTGRRRKRR